MDCFVGMLIGLLKTRHINLVEMSTGFVSDAQQESRYRGIQCFMHGHFLSFDQVAWFIMVLFGFLDSPFYLGAALFGQNFPAITLPF